MSKRHAIAPGGAECHDKNTTGKHADLAWCVLFVVVFTYAASAETKTPPRGRGRVRMARAISSACAAARVQDRQTQYHDTHQWPYQCCADRNYLKTCAMLGIEPTPRDQALGLIGEWTEALTGRREPTTH